MMSRWIELVGRQLRWVVVGLILASLLAMGSARQLTLDGDLARLLPQTAPSASALRALDGRYGAQVGRLTLVMRQTQGSPDPEALRAAARALSAPLRQLPGVARVELVDPLSELEPYRLLYLSMEDVELLVARLSKRIRWERQRANPLFAGLDQAPPSADMSDIEARYTRSARTYYEGQAGELLVFVHPDFPASDLDGCVALVGAVERLVAKQLQDQPIRVELTGRYAKRPEQQGLMKADMGRATGLAMLLLVTFLSLYFRSARALVLVLGPLVLGTLVTLGLARVIFGSLNILTGFLGAILLGLGVDYGIHLVGRYRALRAAGQGASQALQGTFLTTGRANLYAGLTTMAALGSMMVSGFRAFREFGVIAVLGITMILLAYAAALPAMTLLFERLRPERWPGSSQVAEPTWPAARSGPRALGALALGAAVMVATALGVSLGVSSLRMDDTFDSLQITDTRVWELDSQVNVILGQSQTPAIVLAQDEAHAERVRQELERRKLHSPQGYSVDRVITARDLLPAEQAAKRQALATLIEQIDRVPERARSQELRRFEDELRQLLALAPLTAQTLPQNLRAPLSRLDREDASVLLLLPSVNLSVPEHLRAFGAVGRGLPSPAPDQEPVMAINDNQLLIDIIALVREDLRWMVGLTLLGLLGVTWVALGLSLDALILAGALALSMSAAAGALGLLGQPINFINVLIVPVWLGLAVDASYHLLLQLREQPQALGALWRTARSVGAAFATSMIGFGTLAISRHAGLASLGRSALVGLSLILLIELSVIILVVWARARARSPHADPTTQEPA